MIKSTDLPRYLKQPLKQMYIITGQDHYLANHSTRSIKQAVQQNGAYEETILELNQSADWERLHEEANSYSLFSEFVLIDARVEKKSIDVRAKKILQHYLLNPNPQCIILLQAPNIPIKQLQPFEQHKNTLIVQASALSQVAMRQWIHHQLKHHRIQYDPNVPDLIQRYTQGNMLACAQVIEKLALTTLEHERVTDSAVQEHLTNECHYQLYELADACLSAQAEKAVLLLRRSIQTRTEPTLILWLLSQEIRLLFKLTALSKSISFEEACQRLKIWPQKIKYYKDSVSRLNEAQLQNLLTLAQRLDKLIKSNQTTLVWHGLENMALTLALGTHYVG